MDIRRPLAATALVGLLAAPLTGAAALAAGGPAIDSFTLRGAVEGGAMVSTQLARSVHHTLVRRDARLARQVRSLGGHAPSRHALRRMDNEELGRLQARLRQKRRHLHALQVRDASGSSSRGDSVPGALQAIAACESGGDPHAIGGGGAFRGKYQFTRETWAAIGGSGDPAAAPEAEQDRLAARLYATAGPGQWPVCSR